MNHLSNSGGGHLGEICVKIIIFFWPVVQELQLTVCEHWLCLDQFRGLRSRIYFDNMTLALHSVT